MADNLSGDFRKQEPENEGSKQDQAQLKTGIRGVVFWPVLIFLLLIITFIIVASAQTNYSASTKAWLIVGALFALAAVSGAASYAKKAYEALDAGVLELKARRTKYRDSTKELFEQVSSLRGEETKLLLLGVQRSLTSDESGNLNGIRESIANLEKLLNQVATAEDFTAPSDREAISATLLMNIVIFVVGGLVVVSFATAGQHNYWAASVLWSSACLLIGGTAGFLFGVPRFRSEGKTPLTSNQRADTPETKMSTPTNVATSVAAPSKPAATATNDQSPIEQIADWLTKTIVGVALVNLKVLPHQFRRFADVIADGISDGGCPVHDTSSTSIFCQASSFSLGLIIYFVSIGFLSGYLLTQFFLERYINRAEV